MLVLFGQKVVANQPFILIDWPENLTGLPEAHFLDSADIGI